jgi:hypothetical protein
MSEANAVQPDGEEGGALDNIQIEFVEEPVQIRVNMACLTWGDLLAIQKQLSGDQTEEDSIKMFSAIVSKVTGQDAYTLPAQVMTKLIPMIMQRAQGIMPKN